ncbi:MAG: serine/threonine protein kinase [Myxococcales bacterium]|nr:serine/threonine protein kinase [Myxococcales bacterium]
MTVDPDLESGARVGEYEVEARIGQGAFGTVFKAVHPLIGKVVAIKVLARRFSVDPEMVSRFAAEARAVNQIRNRHIIDIFSFGQLEDGRQYYVMEYLDGEPLDALIERAGTISIVDALPILRGIAKALDAAHAKGIAHRDLKAENVFLASDPDGGSAGVWPKLLDFGIAKLMSPEDGLKHKTRTGSPIGTPYYMSPEQCRGRDVDHRTDHYAFGVLTYVMLTGVYPFDADDYMSILVKQLNDQPAPASTLVPELPPAVDDVIAWLMQKDPAQRPSDLRSAVRALEEAAATAGLAPPSTTVWDAQTGPIARAQVSRPPNVGNALPSELDVAPARAGGSKTRLLIALAVALALCGGIAMVVTRRSAREPASTGSNRGTDQGVVPARPAEPAKLAPAVVAPDEPVVPQFVILNITGAPEGTEVFAGGMTVGVAPGPVQLPRDPGPLVLTFKADGFVITSKEVVPDRDQDLAVTMKKRAGAATKKRTRDDLLDPFGGKN